MSVLRALGSEFRHTCNSFDWVALSQCLLLPLATARKPQRLRTIKSSIIRLRLRRLLDSDLQSSRGSAEVTYLNSFLAINLSATFNSFALPQFFSTCRQKFYFQTRVGGSVLSEAKTQGCDYLVIFSNCAQKCAAFPYRARQLAHQGIKCDIHLPEVAALLFRQSHCASNRSSRTLDHSTSGNAYCLFTYVELNRLLLQSEVDQLQHTYNGIDHEHSVLICDLLSRFPKPGIDDLTFSCFQS